MITTHKLKTLPRYFSEIISGEKNFEIRFNDRDFRVGDILELYKYDPEEGDLGDRCRCEVKYITAFAQQPGYIVMGLKKPGASQ